jgi:predicted Na+-dependent transporter
MAPDEPDNGNALYVFALPATGASRITAWLKHGGVPASVLQVGGSA